MTLKQQCYELFEQGYDHLQVMELIPTASRATVRTYYCSWQSNKPKPKPEPQEYYSLFELGYSIAETARTLDVTYPTARQYYTTWCGLKAASQHRARFSKPSLIKRVRCESGARFGKGTAFWITRS